MSKAFVRESESEDEDEDGGDGRPAAALPAGG